jgi:hypothetical protein
MGLVLSLASPNAIQAQFDYLTGNGAVTITAYTGSEINVTIPFQINGLPVTAIGDSAFRASRSLTVNIPDTITSIGDLTFFYSALTNIAIPSSVTNIGSSAFGSCFGLRAIIVDADNSSYSSANGVLFNKNQTALIQCPCGKTGSYTVPDSTTYIGDSAFADCFLTSVTIGSSVTNIGDSAFSGCDLQNFMIPDRVLNIGFSAFAYCSGLTNVTIGNSVTNIGDSAFYSCYDLTNVAIPDSVLRIGNQSFEACFSLAAIGVDPHNPAYSSLDGVLFDKNQTTLLQFPEARTGSYVVPNSVTNIGDWAFSRCNLTRVTIPDSVSHIGAYAFSFCSGLTTVTIPDSVISFGGFAFVSCTNLISVFFQDSFPAILDNGNGLVPFFGDPVILYYLPGTTGWGPADILWNPTIQATNPGFGVQSNGFNFSITGTPGIPLAVEASTNLASGVWGRLQTFSLTNGLVSFLDPAWTNYPSRFYRLTFP